MDERCRQLEHRWLMNAGPFYVPIEVCGHVIDAVDFYNQLLDRGETPADAAACVDNAVEEYWRSVARVRSTAQKKEV